MAGKERQAGTGECAGAPLLYRDVAVPDGLTFADLYEAAQLVWTFNHEDGPAEGEPRNEFELVARVYERLKAAAARNQDGS